MRLNTNTAKSRLNEKHYQKELFKYKLKHWFESMNTLRLANHMDVGLTATVMVLLMLPAFLFAMYEKDGMHLEDVLMHMIRVKFLRPPVRKYETENYYETDPEQIRQSPDAGKPKGGKTVAKKEK